MHIHKILVVDDDVHLTDAIARYLRHAHYEVLSARDGAGGLERLSIRQSRQAGPPTRYQGVPMHGQDPVGLPPAPPVTGQCEGSRRSARDEQGECQGIYHGVTALRRDRLSRW